MRRVPCPTCGGSGKRPAGGSLFDADAMVDPAAPPEDADHCPTCAGAGTVEGDDVEAAP